MMMSPVSKYNDHRILRLKEVLNKNNVRGLGGRAGRRSIITDRGGTGIGGKFRTTV